MSKQPGGKASKGLTEVIGRALMDEQFREKFFKNRSEAIKDYNLSAADRAALEQLSQQDLQQNAEVFGSATSAAIKIVVKGTF